jgi:Spy/CpxP family protein refolding chaperone
MKTGGGMNKIALIIFLLVTATLTVAAQEGHSPYAGQEARAIKALSTEEVQQYLTGAGMGFAKAAELNQYPGPKHVLELAEKLSLSEEQLAQAQAIRAAMAKEAVRLGKLLLAQEASLDRLFAEAVIDEPQLEKLVGEIAVLRGQVRAAHLRAHLEMRRVMTPHQIHRYQELRGYGTSHTHKQQ